MTNATNKVNICKILNELHEVCVAKAERLGKFVKGATPDEIMSDTTKLMPMMLLGEQKGYHDAIRDVRDAVNNAVTGGANTPSDRSGDVALAMLELMEQLAEGKKVS